MTTVNTNTTNPNTNTTNQPGLLDRATSFFKGTSKKPTNTLTSSLEHLHTSQHAQADAEAQHQADLMSGLPSGGTPEGTQSLSSSTIPQPMPRQVLNDVLGAHGHVPHAHHVDVDKVEQRHEQAVGPLGHVQQPSLLDKAKQAIDSLTGKSTTTQHPIQHHPNIPHSVLPDATLKQVQTAQGHPPHAHHVDVEQVEQRHNTVPLGHVQPEPTVLEKMSNKIQELVPPATFSSTSTTVQTHPAIPHAAVPDQVLLDVQSQKGKVPHAQHVDVGKVEQRHEQAIGPLGQVQKEPGILERVGNKLSELVPSLAPTTTASTSNIPIHTHPNIPHSALSNNVLRDIQLHHGKVPHARHVDIHSIEKKHEQLLGLGHVQDITLLHKAKHAIDSMTGKTVAPLKLHPIQQHRNIPHSALPDATLLQIQASHGQPPHAKHINIGLVEQRYEQASGPLGRVLPGPTMLEKINTKIEQLTQPLAQSITAATITRPTASQVRPTSSQVSQVDQHPNIPHAAVPNQVLHDIESQKGKVPHAHHVDLDQVEKRHQQAVGPLGHVQQEPTLLNKMGDKLQDMINRPTTTTTTTSTLPVDEHPTIRHAAVPDQVLKDVQHQKGKVPHAHHVDLPKVEQRHEQAVGPLGHVQKEPTLMDKAKTAVFGDLSSKPSTTKSTVPVDEHPNIPHAAVPDQVLKDVQHQKGKVPHAHHIDINKVEQQHEQAVGPLGHVQKEPTLMDKTKHALGLEKDKDKPLTTHKDQTPIPAPTHDLHLKKVPDAKFINTTTPETTLHPASLPGTTTTALPHSTASSLPSTTHPSTTASSLSGSTLPATTASSLPGTTTLPLNDQGITSIPSQGTTTATPNVVPVEPTLLDKVEYKLFGVVPTKAAPTTTSTTPTTAAETKHTKPTSTTTTSTDQHPNIPHSAVPDQVLKDVQHQKGKVPHAHHVDVGKVEQRHEQAVGPLGHVQKEPTLMDKAKHALGMDKDKTTTTTNKDETLKHQAPTDETHIIGRVDDKAQPNIMHNSLPTRVMNELKDQHGHVPHAKHVDIGTVEGQRERRLSQEGMIGRVVDRKNGDVNQIEKDPQRRSSDPHMLGRTQQPYLEGSKPLTQPIERSNSGYTAGGFQASNPNLGGTSGFQGSNLPNLGGTSTAYFKNTGSSSSGTSSHLPGSSSSSGTSSNLPASSLTSDIGNKSGLTSSNTDLGNKSGLTSSSKSSTTTPLVATLPAGSNLETGSGMKFQPADQPSTTTSNIKPPTFHPQK